MVNKAPVRRIGDERGRRVYRVRSGFWNGHPCGSINAYQCCSMINAKDASASRAMTCARCNSSIRRWITVTSARFDRFRTAVIRGRFATVCWNAASCPATVCVVSMKLRTDARLSLICPRSSSLIVNSTDIAAACVNADIPVLMCWLNKGTSASRRETN